MEQRLIRKEEIVRGVIAKLGMNMGTYSACTIVMVRDDEVHICRPYVYAHQNFDSKTGLIGMEQFSMSMKRATECLFVEIDTQGKPPIMVT